LPNEVKLATFPDDAIEALALIYVQNQDLSGKSPEDLLTMYYEAYYAMKRDKANKRESGWFTDLRE